MPDPRHPAVKGFGGLRSSASLARGSALLLKLPPWVWGAAFLALLGLSSLTAGAGRAGQPGGFPDSSAGLLALGLNVLFKLGLVIASIYGSMILFRRWRAAFPSRPDRQIKLLETTRLSPRQAIHLVRVKDQVLLIGATDQGLTLLAEFEGLAEERLPESPEVFSLSFEGQLSERLPKSPAESSLPRRVPETSEV